METKKQFKWYTIFEYEKEQDYLRNMHRSGWKLVKVKGLGVYSFEKCVPQDVVYQLDYNKEGLSHKDEYLKMFDDCGWEYIQNYGGYSYFRKAVATDGAAEEIFCDEESRLEMMRRVLKGRMLPLLLIFFAALVPMFIINLSNHDYLNVVCIGSVLVLYTVVFVMCFVKFRRYKTRINK